MEQETPDPVAICIEALQNGTGKELALKQADIAYSRWRAVDVSDKNLSMDELKDLLRIRSIVMATIATVYVWNNDTNTASQLEDEFLFDEELWQGNNRQVIDIYLMQLIIQKQTEHLNIIFQDADFRKSFLEYEDVYLSSINPDYEFKSNGMIFTTLINRINSYSRMLTGQKLM